MSTNCVRTKTLIIAIDGFCAKIYEKVKNQGGFSKLGDIMQKGRAYAPRINLCTRGWPVIFTGRNPGEVGGYYFVVDRHNYMFTEKFTADDYSQFAIWQKAKNYGSRFLVMGIPSTFPPQKINGVFISAGAAGVYPEGISELVYPQSIINKYAFLSDCYVPDVRIHKFDATTVFIEALINETNIKVDSAIKIIKNEKLDTSIIGFVGCDRIAHSFWPYIGNEKPNGGNQKIGAMIKQYFKVLEKSIIRLVDEISPEKTIIVSDHGMTGRHYTLYINRLLIEYGLAQENKNLSAIMKEWGQKFIGNHFTPKERQKIKNMLKLFRRIAGYVPLHSPALDWRQTKAFGYYSHGIYINRRGMYSKGIVRDRDYESLRKRIIELLKSVVDDEKKPIFEWVGRREDVFFGEHLHNAPDVVFEIRDEIDVRGNTNVKNSLVRFDQVVYGEKISAALHNGIHSRWPFLFMLVKRPGDYPDEIDTLEQVAKV